MDFSWIMKFIRAFVSAFGFALRKKAWKAGKWVDAVCQHDAPSRVNVFATYSYDYNVQLYLWLHRSVTRRNQPVWISLTSSRYEHVGEYHRWHSHDWIRIYENLILQFLDETIFLQFLRQILNTAIRSVSTLNILIIYFRNLNS